MDMSSRMQLFDLKTTYRFQTTPGIDSYNMPLYSAQIEGQGVGSSTITPFPIYQGFTSDCTINGITAPFYTQRQEYWNLWPNYIQPLQDIVTGDGTTLTFQFQLPFFPAIPGHVDMMGIVSTGNTEDPIFTNSLVAIPSTSVKPGVYITYTSINGSNVVITDSGQFLDSASDGTLYGLLMQPGNPPYGNLALNGGYSMTTNTVDYNTGLVNVTFFDPPAANVPIQVQCYFYQQGIPRSILYYNNTITVRPPPNTQYIIELGAYLTPAAFLQSSNAVPFAYMSEYIARGAARKILSDTGDIEQFQFYEPLFREQEMLVWKRSQRQITATRTPTIFSQGGGITNSNFGQGTMS
tara:strand:- start:1110 stop:2162 length:1053 start_codon:yes stop_codon:yes gene_type:complete